MSAIGYAASFARDSFGTLFRKIFLPVNAGSAIPQAAIVAREAANDVFVSATDAAGIKLAGVAVSKLDNTDGSDGVVSQASTPARAIDVAYEGVYEFAVVGAPKRFDPAYVRDNNTVGTTPGTNVLPIGFFLSPTKGGKWYVHVQPFPLQYALGLVSGGNFVVGLTGGIKLAGGVVTPASASHPVITGLATVTSVSGNFAATAASVNHMWNAFDIGDQAGTPDAGTFLLKSTKPTSTNDVTPTATTASWLAVRWLAIGT